MSFLGADESDDWRYSTWSAKCELMCVSKRVRQVRRKSQRNKRGGPPEPAHASVPSSCTVRNHTLGPARTSERGHVASLASLASTDGRMRRCLKRTVILNNIIIIDEQTGHHDMIIYDVHLHGCIYHADVIMLLPRHPSR